MPEPEPANQIIETGESENRAAELPFPLVGIGASAGGLEAFREFLSAVPAGTGMAFVLIQHLDPTHKSQLAEILSRTTVMPVCEAADGMAVEPNHVYVIPSNTTLRAAAGTLRLHPRPAAPALHLPVDEFFLSLADAQGPRAIGVILSGTASDGAEGVKAIKEHGGITFAQDEHTARYSGMPGNAVATGAVDFVLPPASIAAELARVGAHPYVSTLPSQVESEEVPEDDATLRKIFALLQRSTQVNFALYKPGTLRRRLMRRMIVHGCGTLADYLQYLNRHPEELQSLYDDILISVTSFFRDPPVFEAIATHLNPVVRDKGNQNSLRVWIPGCASGEEVYSLAICLDEIAGQDGRHVTLQLFGTDINEAALQRARAGVYPETIANAVSPERLQRYFAKVEAGYRIKKSIRDACIFARQDVTVDPPFSRLDLVSCRNLLIYLAASLQRTVLPMFHYSLNPAGLLVLGSAEGLGTDGDLFQTLDPENRIYRRKAAPARRSPPFPTYRNPAEPETASTPARALTGAELKKHADLTVQARYAPDGVVIGEDMQILQFRGHTGFYLEPVAGEATLDLLRMARESLQLPLRRTVAAAIRYSRVAREEGLRIEHAGELREIDLEVIPIAGATPRERYFLVVFEQRKASKTEPPEEAAAQDIGTNLAGRIARLERELADAREYLHTITQEHETALEELRAANEEAASANEELQSTNEELRTAKEETQSTNEELTTLNDELQNRNHELGRLYNDLENLLTAVRLPILMVDRDLRLRRFTPSAEQWLSLLPTDIGCPITAFRGRLGLPNLSDLVRTTIDDLKVETLEMRDPDGRWWTLTIRPYRTAEHRIDGAVLTFIDVDALKRSVQQAEHAQQYAEAVTETVSQPLLVLGPDVLIEKANAAFYRMFQLTREDAEGRSLQELGRDGWDIPELLGLLREIAHSNGPRTIEVERLFPRIGMKTMCFTGQRIVSPGSSRQALLLAISDVTEQRRAERALVRSNEELQSFAYVVAHDLQEPLRTVAGFTDLLERKHLGAVEDAELLKFITDAVSRMQAMIHDLLLYSRVSAVEVGSAEPVSAKLCLQEAIWNLQGVIQETGALVTNDELPSIPFHPQQLAQLFQNLIGNALKYRRADPPRVYISADRREREWVFSIRDNGLGFSPEHAERIFLAFKRLHGREYPGTGIGLAICRRIVERHGGRIWAESQPGAGSTFFFTAPV